MNRKLVLVGRILTGILSLLLAMSGVMKLVGGDDVAESFVHLGLPETLRVPIGIVELACVAIYLVPASAIIGAILLTGYMGGAILTHARVGEPVFAQIAIGIAAWAGLWLREPRLRALMPVRRGVDG